MEVHSEKIRGEDIIVEVEAKIEKRKYIRGLSIESEFLEAMSEIMRKLMLIAPVTERTKETLME